MLGLAKVVGSELGEILHTVVESDMLVELDTTVEVDMFVESCKVVPGF